jgi:hypothetical protein
MFPIPLIALSYVREPLSQEIRQEGFLPCQPASFGIGGKTTRPSEANKGSDYDTMFDICAIDGRPDV